MILYIYKLLRAILRVTLIVINNIYTTIAYCTWVLLILPIKPFNKELYTKIEETLYGWILSIVAVWSWSAGYKIIEMGDRLTPCTTGKVLVLINHQSTADVPIIMALFNVNNYIKNIMWIMDWIFCLTHFGFISYLHGDLFVLSGSQVREDGKKRLKEHIIATFLPLNKKCIILFPEGGFLRKRRERSKHYAIEHNISNTICNVALPRTGALLAIMETFLTLHDKDSANYLNNDGNQIKWILDITIAYEDGIPLDLLTILTAWRKPCKTYIFYRLIPGSQIPAGDGNITKWLYDLWEEKDKILETFYKQEMPYKYCKMYNKGAELQYSTEVKQNPIRLILVNVFFLFSTYLQCRIIYYFFTILWEYKYSV